MAGDGRGVFSDVAAIFAVVFGDGRRFLRFAGLPGVAAVALNLAFVVLYPQPESQEEMAAWAAEAFPFMTVFWTVWAWAFARMFVRWCRWGVTGEDAIGFFTPGFGARELRLLGWSVVMGLATIPAFLFAGIVISAVTALGGFAGAMVGGEAGTQGGMALGTLLGLLLGFLPVMMVLGRLGVGLVPVALDRPSALLAAWRATEGWAVRLMWLMLLIEASILVPSLLGGYAGPAGVLVLTAVTAVLSLAVTAAFAVLVSRVYRETLGAQPGA
ncbi:MAG TPA: hypothetical protein VEB20_14945 [Azospirillaceae bacterium]|nr:hypothetical protein [Azospirillaceae bacterium]